MRTFYETYYCNHCNHTFDEVEERRNYPVAEFPEYETYYVCPCCGNEDYEEAFKCEICGEYHPESEEGDSENVCKACENKIFSQFFSLLEESFSSDEQRIIKKAYRI